MNDGRLSILHEYLHGLSNVDTYEKLNILSNECINGLEAYDDEINATLLNDVRSILGRFANNNNKDILRRNYGKFDTFTEVELLELNETNRIIDGNLFDYHFQPIVSAINGHIYSYEALMRPKSDICPSPYHILKYAEFTNRLNDIERLTFVNVLLLVREKKEEFANRKIFINSIPKTRLSDDANQEIKQLLIGNSGNIVIEMTEQAEFDDDEFVELKGHCNRMNIQIAVDDYGTGYSNIKNLLEYMPHYVKIDRNLIYNINNDRKKRHFVREIVEFCRDNGILSLAEGVETSEELRTVIRLGIDLVQGYYTSRPSAEIVDKIPYEIRQEIKRYHLEREQGKDVHIYTAEKSDRIVLGRVAKEGYKCIYIGKNGDGEVRIVGVAGVEYNITIEIAKGFNGKLILDNVWIMNNQEIPSITLGENCEVYLELTGSNRFNNSGIKVPENSKLTCGGKLGSLYIYVNGNNFFGIGNDENSKHGEIIFEQGVTIDNNSPSGICVGSGLGGKIKFKYGKHDFKMSGNYGVALGSFTGKTDIDIYSADITVDLAVSVVVGIGSMDGNAKVRVSSSHLSVTNMGVKVVGIGTLTGKLCDFKISEAKTIVRIHADTGTAIGAWEGRTDFKLERGGIHALSEGKETLAIGGLNKENYITFSDSDTYLHIRSKIKVFNDCYLPENVKISGGRTRFYFNEEQVALL